MTEESHSQIAAAPDSPVPSVSLREAREAAGLQLAALAVTLKVPVERLLALEEGRYQDLPNPTFARALASSVCRVLKIDPVLVLRGLPQIADVKLVHGAAIQAVVDMPRRRRWPKLSSASLRSPVVWTCLLLLLALALWWWLPQRDSAQSLLSPPELPPQGAGVVVEPLAPTSQPMALPPSQPTANQVAQPTVVVEPQPAPPAISPAPSAAAQASVAAAAAVQAAAAQPLIQLRARATTWVQLKDATGRELQQKTLQPGQTLDYDGQGPVQVVLGRANGVDVIVRGQPYDTSSFASNRVARFEVK